MIQSLSLDINDSSTWNPSSVSLLCHIHVCFKISSQRVVENVASSPIMTYGQGLEPNGQRTNGLVCDTLMRYTHAHHHVEYVLL